LRYGKSELAGAITSFAKKWLHFSRDRFTEKGYRVLYGDTDSLFVESGLTDESSYAQFLEWGKNLAADLSLSISSVIKKEYGLKSHLELRFEKPYRRFMIPPLRNFPGSREENTVQNLELIAFNGQFTFKANGITRLEYYDPRPLRSGKIGLRTWNTKLWWNNIRVYSLDHPT